jgi:hypothetical protein
VVTDSRGTPLAIEVTAGKVHEANRGQAVIEEATATLIGRRRKRWRRRHKPRQLAGDKAYSVRRLREWLSDQRIEPVIPYKDNQRERRDSATRRCVPRRHSGVKTEQFLRSQAGGRQRGRSVFSGRRG